MRLKKKSVVGERDKFGFIQKKVLLCCYLWRNFLKTMRFNSCIAARAEEILTCRQQIKG